MIDYIIDRRTIKRFELDESEARTIAKAFLRRQASWNGEELMIRDGIIHVEKYHPRDTWWEVLVGVDPDDPSLLFALRCYQLWKELDAEDRAKTR